MGKKHNGTSMWKKYEKQWCTSWTNIYNKTIWSQIINQHTKILQLWNCCSKAYKWSAMVYEKRWTDCGCSHWFSAAFDTVDHSVLLSVLENKYGISNKPLNWFRNFLKNRQFQVTIDGAVSDVKTFNFSVAQGSCSRPTLFRLYSTTLPDEISPLINIMAFADDHTLYKSFKPADGMETRTKLQLEDSLLQIDGWMKENHLKMNTQKTEFIVFGSRMKWSNCELNSLKVVNDTVTKTDNIKLHGSWKPIIQYTCNKKVQISNAL